MAQDPENQTPSHNFNGNLATKLDPTFFGKIVSNGAESSKATSSKVISNGAESSKTASKRMISNAAESSKAVSKQKKPQPTPATIRQQKIAEVLGDPKPKDMIKDGKLTWTPSPQASSSKYTQWATSSTQSVSQPSGLPPSSNSLAKAFPTIPNQASKLPECSSLKPLTGSPSAVSASQSSNFPCPYADCKRGFLKEGDLRKHKMQDHDYCKICDIDFEDDEAFHKHKILDERHITCTVCSLDFKSETGRDRHYNVMHAASHNVKCRGCDTTFAKGAALLLHFEQNLCRPKDKDGISADRFEAQRAAMAMVLETKNIEKATQSGSVGGSLSRLQSIGIGGSVAASSVYGGVPIEASEQPDFLTDHNYGSPSLRYPSLSGASDTTEKPSSRTNSDAGTDLLSFDDDRRDALNASNLAALNHGNMLPGGLADWPTLGMGMTKGKGKGKAKDDVVEGMSNLSISATKRGANEAPLSPGIYAPPSVQPSQSGYSIAGEMKGVELQPNVITGEWECPYFKCGFKALLRQDLEAHFDDRNNGHRGFEYQCPSCLKRFKTASAMMAHLESPTVRCTIRESKGFGNILHLVSGGHLNISGRHNDGTNRLVVPKDPAKTTESMMW
ncbi:MAG: hypothetical protein Q9209_005066 [Squamulea sp. 1 TL-2023]